MTIELSWIASSPASALAAARVLLDGGPSVDAKTALVEPSVGQLAALLDALHVPRARFFDEAIPLAIHYERPPQLAARVSARLFGQAADPLTESRLSACLAELHSAWQSAHPQALAELELRAEPLRQQWEARGPGLLAGVARLTERGLLVDRADVILLLPVAGGAGSSHWSCNAVAIEAVLANPIAALPEVVRLAWLLAQLNLDLPSLHADLSPLRIREIGPLAMIPPVLAAAEEVELARYDAQLVATALDAWQAPQAGAETLVAWWETYQASRPPWPVALAALERMLS